MQNHARQCLRHVCNKLLIGAHQTCAVLAVHRENFVKMDPRSQPTLHGPTGPMVPDPMKEGPHRYEGEWRPWLKPSEGRNYYPSKYDGPGYPPKGAVVW